MEVRLLRLCEQTISQMPEPGKDENGSYFGCLIREIVTPIRHPRRKKLGPFVGNWGQVQRR
jgi:hypothetical protein